MKKSKKLDDKDVFFVPGPIPKDIQKKLSELIQKGKKKAIHKKQAA